MNTFRSLILVLVIFLVGAFAGAIITGKIIELRVRRVAIGGPDTVADLVVRRFGAHLKLDKPQKAELLAIVREAQKEMRLIRKDEDPKIEAILERAEIRARSILKPEQSEKFDRLVKERKTDWETIKTRQEKE